MFEFLGALAYVTMIAGYILATSGTRRENISSRGVLSAKASDTKLLPVIVDATAKKHDQGEVPRSRPQQDAHGDGQRSSLQDRNICYLIQESHELGIETSFWAETSNAQEVTLNWGFLCKAIPGREAMKFPHRRFFRLAASAGALTAISLTIPLAAYDAQSQTTRTTKLVVPFPPGGSADTLARLLADQIGRTRGLTLIVENRPGAGAVIGYEAVSRAAPDGNTLLVNAPSFVINPQLRKVNYDPLTGFEPICYLVRLPLVIVVNSASPYRTLADLLTAARTKPGELSLASVGPATIQHIAFEMLKRSANVDITFVPYSGNPAAVNALLGGHVTAVFSNYDNVIDQLNAGKLRALATGSGTRIESLPQVPTVSEAGYKDYEADNWFGLVAPSKTPREVISQVAEWAKAAMLVPEVKTKLVDLALYPVGMCGADFAAHLRKQYEHYGRVIREGNLKAQ